MNRPDGDRFNIDCGAELAPGRRPQAKADRDTIRVP